MSGLKLAFAGTPEFARVALAALHAAGHSIHLVLTQPDRPAGRGLKLQASPVKQFALQHGIPVVQPRSLRLDGKYPDDARMAQAVLQEGSLDAMVVAAYGLILPQWVLDLPLSGCFNIHASSLPRWRGAAPIHRAIEAGDSRTGVTIMQMDAGLDTGDMVLAQTLSILPTDTTGSLHDKLADLGATLMVQTLSQLQAGKLQRLPQPADGICYASKIDKLEARVDWNQTAEVIARRVRAFNPNPVAHTSLNGEPLKIWAAHAAEGTSAALPECGTILAVSHNGIDVAAIDSVLILTELQRPGGKRLPIAEFLRGFDVKLGMRLV